jgi:hypothetical protein
MTVKRGILILVGVCALVVLLSLFGFVSAFLTHLDLSLDGLLLILISLMMAAIFALTLLSMLKEAGLLPAPRKAEAPQAAAAPPAAARPPENAVAKSEATVPVRSGEGK